MTFSNEYFRQAFFDYAAELEAACGDWEHAEVDQESLDRMRDRALVKILEMEKNKGVQ